MIPTITPVELNQLQSKSSGIRILDVRTPVEFAAVHATTAFNVPLDQLDPAQIISQRNGASDLPLYVICKMGGRSQKACEKFVAAGFDNVVNVAAGTDGWVAAGLPVNQGERKFMALDRQVRIAAGSLVLIGFLLGYFVHPAFAWLSAFVGAGLVFSGVTDTCAMGTVLSKMPWNQIKKNTDQACESG